MESLHSKHLSQFQGRSSRYEAEIDVSVWSQLHIRQPGGIGQKVDKWLRNWSFISKWSAKPFNYAYFRKLWMTSNSALIKPSAPQLPVFSTLYRLDNKSTCLKLLIFDMYIYIFKCSYNMANCCFTFIYIWQRRKNKN
jgi:hypothetical protein